MKYFNIFLILLISNFCKGQDLNQKEIPGLKTVSTSVSLDTSNYTTFFVYRPKKWKNHLNKYSVNINDSVINRITNNSKHTLKIYKEGHIQIWAQTGDKKSILEVESKFGDSYYIKCSFDVGFYMVYPKLILMSKGEGMDEWNAIDAKSEGDD